MILNLSLMKKLNENWVWIWVWFFLFLKMSLSLILNSNSFWNEFEFEFFLNSQNELSFEFEFKLKIKLILIENLFMGFSKNFKTFITFACKFLMKVTPIFLLMCLAVYFRHFGSKCFGLIMAVTNDFGDFGEENNY